MALRGADAHWSACRRAGAHGAAAPWLRSLIPAELLLHRWTAFILRLHVSARLAGLLGNTRVPKWRLSIEWHRLCRRLRDWLLPVVFRLLSGGGCNVQVHNGQQQVS